MGVGGPKIFFFPKFNQIWCVSYLDEVKGSITIRFLRERGDLRWRAIECVLVLFVMTPGAQTTGNIAVYGSAKQLVIKFMVWTANLTKF